jgi:flagellar biosynthesis/type III secretory pathway chaperone
MQIILATPKQEQFEQKMHFECVKEKLTGIVEQKSSLLATVSYL